MLAPLALYVADTGTTLLRRIARGDCWYLPHRDHVYQRLRDSGWSSVRVSLLVLFCVAACGGLGAVSLSSSLVARVIADVAIVAVIGSYLLAPRCLPRGGSEVVAPDGG